jgi:hypothetical protein
MCALIKSKCIQYLKKKTDCPHIFDYINAVKLVFYDNVDDILQLKHINP